MFTATISRVSKHRDLVRVVPLVLWSMSRSFDPVRCFNPPFASASRMCDLQRTYVCGQDVKGIACTHARTSACTQGSRVQPTSREDMLEGANGGGGSGAGPSFSHIQISMRHQSRTRGRTSLRALRCKSPRTKPST